VCSDTPSHPDGWIGRKAEEAGHEGLVSQSEGEAAESQFGVMGHLAHEMEATAHQVEVSQPLWVGAQQQGEWTLGNDRHR